jgi:hypothetical protein
MRLLCKTFLLLLFSFLSSCFASVSQYIRSTKWLNLFVKERKALLHNKTKERSTLEHTHTHTKKEKNDNLLFIDHFESLLITRINAAFSSFRRVLSALIESNFYEEKKRKSIQSRSFFVQLTFDSSSNSDIFLSYPRFS